MDLPNLKELSKIIDLCRKKSIESVKIGQDSIELKFKESSLGKRPYRRKGSPDTSRETIETPDALSELETLFWSSTGAPSPDGSHN